MTLETLHSVKLTTAWLKKVLLSPAHCTVVWSVGGTVGSESALRSTVTFLSWARAPRYEPRYRRLDLSEGLKA
ncbi:hypothetical protein PoB_001277900 [Plakobranchus ocellatus]|uniref:Uncharacterized protein n=1 Tax=Plakobranchus ocellatus TaxID=259542 RepID=A0AAV3YX26_9GAST|nr:hypothetical protein PoB_001277900 [Plakobranchus ocellatus]